MSIKTLVLPVLVVALLLSNVLLLRKNGHLVAELQINRRSNELQAGSLAAPITGTDANGNP